MVELGVPVGVGLGEGSGADGEAEGELDGWGEVVGELEDGVSAARLGEAAEPDACELPHAVEITNKRAAAASAFMPIKTSGVVGGYAPAAMGDSCS